jgi:hypothetical protein
MKEFKAKVIELDEAFFLTLEQTDNIEKAVDVFKTFKEEQSQDINQLQTMIDYIESEKIVTPLTDSEREVLVDSDAGCWYKVPDDIRSNLV